MVDYKEALEKPFTDLKKLLIGMLLSILPVINWFAVGFEMNCSNVGKIKSKKMPEWKNFGNLFKKGFFNFAIAFIYIILPVLILMLSAGKIVLDALGKIPLAQLQAATTDEARTAILQPIIQGMVPSLIAVLPLVIFAVILSILVLYIIPIAVLSYLENERFSDAFKIKEIFKKAFTGKYFVIWLLVTVLSILINNIFKFIPYIGDSISAFIIGVIAFSLIGQVYLELSEKSVQVKRAKKRRKH
jgi:hypothetical protein